MEFKSRDAGSGMRDPRRKRHATGRSACGPSEGPEGSAAERRPRVRASGGGAPRALIEEDRMLAIRLRKTGSKKRPFFRVVVTDSRTARDSSFVEVLGFYNPRTNPETLKLD